MSLLPAEARLFLLAIKPREPSDDEAIARLLASPLDWRSLAAIAERERLVSVMWRRMRDHAHAMPRDLAMAVERRTAVLDFRMSATSSLLDRLVVRLAGVGVPSLLLKGAALARSVYPSFVDRPMNDLDILVPADLALDAWKVVHGDGWTLETNDDGEFHAGHHHMRPLVDPSGAGIVLELHRSIMPMPGPFVLDDIGVWGHARRIRVGTSHAWVPTAEHQLLHLSVHFAWSHSLDSGFARSVRDAATLATESAIDWNAFVTLAAEARASTCAYWTLALSRSLLDAPIPDHTLARLRPRQPLAVTRALERAYIASGLLGLSPSVSLARQLWSAGMHPARSGHRRHRPWDSTARLSRILRTDSRPRIAERIRHHVRHAGDWIRFARLVGGP